MGDDSVYAIICNITGTIYIGSSIDIGIRLVRHLVINNTNDHLQNALAKYGAFSCPVHPQETRHAGFDSPRLPGSATERRSPSS